MMRKTKRERDLNDHFYFGCDNLVTLQNAGHVTLSSPIQMTLGLCAYAHLCQCV